MTNLALQPAKPMSRRLDRAARAIWMTVAIAALMALSFALGGATMRHTKIVTKVVHPAVTAPVAPDSGAGDRCNTHGRC